MKQVLVSRGRVAVAEVPAPVARPGSVLVRVAYSLISSGTERATVAGSAASLPRLAIDRPELLVRVGRSLKRNGLRRTLAHVRGALSAASPVGYSCSGTVVAVGEGVDEIRPGDPVACAGSASANHAELVAVPRNLVVRLPPGCEVRDAATVALGSVALQGLRRCGPQLGEVVAVVGLGLVGQLAAQLLRTAGCRVVGLDSDARRVAVAERLGLEMALVADDPGLPAAISELTAGAGVDATVITAATSSDAVVQQSMELTRKKGRVVLVGDVGLGLSRSPFYEKEIDFLVSCSYGPGRYDPAYEEEGRDYPYAYVRWTERRNMEEYLRLVADGRVDLRPLLELEVPVERAPDAYAALASRDAPPIGVLLRYSGEAAPAAPAPPRSRTGPAGGSGGQRLGIAVVGAGGFAQAVHLPNLVALSSRCDLRAVVTAHGHTAREVARRFGAAYASTSLEEVLDDPEVRAVLIATRHHLHARQSRMAISAGKAVYLEKPMSIDARELDGLETALRDAADVFLVGYNRRFSPWIAEVRRHTERRREPLFMRYRVNAGFLPPDHWVHGEEGGGRVVGEACHMIDLFTSLVGSPIAAVSAAHLRPRSALRLASDNAAISVEYADGSLGVVEYLAVGAADLPKEHLEVHFDDKSLVLDDFRALSGHGVQVQASPGAPGDKGHRRALEALLDAAGTGAGPDTWPIPAWDLVQTSRATLAVEELRRSPILSADPSVETPPAVLAEEAPGE